MLSVLIYKMRCTLIYICQMCANACSVKDYMNSSNVSFTGSHKILQTDRLSMKCLKMHFKLCYAVYYFSFFLRNKIHWISWYIYVVYSQYLRLANQTHYFLHLRYLLKNISNHEKNFKINWILIYNETHTKSHTCSTKFLLK